MGAQASRPAHLLTVGPPPARAQEAECPVRCGNVDASDDCQAMQDAATSREPAYGLACSANGIMAACVRTCTRGSQVRR
jgi:hypothetical protein